MLTPVPAPRRSVFARLRRHALSALLLSAVSAVGVPRAAAFTQVFVFGDSLSDDGNITHRTASAFDVGYPGQRFNYSDGRFTNSSDTDPSSTTYVGVWHEQLTARFLNLRRAGNSLDGGPDYAFGGATTRDGSTDRTVVDNPLPFGDNVSITIDNMGKQIGDFLARGPVDPDALYIVWGGGNDLFDDASDANVTATANRVGGLVTRLAGAGARNFLVPNVPPLGAIPEYNGDANKAASLNAASAAYRDQLNGVLDSTVASLNAGGAGVAVYRLDIYNLFLNLTANASAFGFTNVTRSAQGESVKVDTSLFWDSIHPTTSGHSQIAQAAADILPGGHPAFFQGEAKLAGDYDYLVFPNGQPFGYYSYQYFPYLYSTDLGFEYFVAANDDASGAYLYDFGLKTFLYTSPALYPYLYNFQANAFYFYFTGTTNPRVFSNVNTGEIINN